MIDLTAINRNWREIGDISLETALAEHHRVRSPLLSFTKAMWETARPHSALCWAQQFMECQYETDRDILDPGDHNPLNLRPHRSIQVHYGEKAGYATFGSPVDCVKEWKRRITSATYKADEFPGGAYTDRITLDQFIDRFAPPGDKHGSSGVDNAHIEYAKTVRTMLTRFAAMEAATEQEPPMANPYILITAGHRSTNDPGNPVERALTDDLAVAYERAFDAAGYACDWLQEDLDKDGNPTMTVGGLATVAALCNKTLAARTEQLSIMLDLHYNGSRSAIHAIVPDWGTTDTAANNVLDSALAKQIALNIHAANPGMTLFKGRLNLTGVMSEKETGVGLNGSRLGMFSMTVNQRHKAVRLVVEHGGTNDAIRPDFFNRCAQASLKAVQSVIPNQGTVPIPPVDPPVEPPIEERPPVNYPLGLNKTIAERLFGRVGTYTFNEQGPVSMLWLATGSETGRYPRIDEVIEGTPKYFVFADGTVIWQPSPSEALRVMSPVADAIAA